MDDTENIKYIEILEQGLLEAKQGKVTEIDLDEL